MKTLDLNRMEGINGGNRGCTVEDAAFTVLEVIVGISAIATLNPVIGGYGGLLILDAVTTAWNC